MHNNLIDGEENFFLKCDELINSKFILAGSKIAAVISAIAESQALMDLFEMLTSDFDYLSYKKVCLISDGSAIEKFKLPEGTGDKIAFIFCLLMEIDRKSLDFNNFLQTYFYEDGSYFSSYNAFCSQVIKPFKNLIKAALEEVYSDDIESKPISAKIHIINSSVKILTEDIRNVESTRHIDAKEKERLIDFIEQFVKELKKQSGALSSFLYAYGHICEAHKNILKNYRQLEEIMKNRT